MNTSFLALFFFFPSLFPSGDADFYAPRRRSVKLADWTEHMLRYHDGRFGRNPRFCFLLTTLS